MVKILTALLSDGLLAVYRLAPVHMFAYHTAVIMGKDADQLLDLPKSVTVE